jgi:hypothetical protein
LAALLPLDPSDSEGGYWFVAVAADYVFVPHHSSKSEFNHQILINVKTIVGTDEIIRALACCGTSFGAMIPLG